MVQTGLAGPRRGVGRGTPAYCRTLSLGEAAAGLSHVSRQHLKLGEDLFWVLELEDGTGDELFQAVLSPHSTLVPNEEVDLHRSTPRSQVLHSRLRQLFCCRSASLQGSKVVKRPEQMGISVLKTGIQAKARSQDAPCERQEQF